MLWCLDLFQAFSCSLFHSSCCSSTSAGLNRRDENVYPLKLIQRCLYNKCHKKVQKSRNWNGVFGAHWNCIRFVGGQKGWDTDGIEKELTFEPPRQHWLNRSEVRICHNAQMLQMRKFASVPFKTNQTSAGKALTITSFIHWERMWHGLLWWAQICWPQGYKGGGMLRENKHFLREARGLCDVNTFHR